MSAGAVVAGLAGCSGLPEEPSPPQSDPSPPASDSEAGPPLNGPWPTAQADAANTGAIEASGPQGSPSVRWQGHVTLDTRIRATVGPDGPIATQADGTLLAYESGGPLRWRRHHDDAFVAAPVVAADGTIVVGTRDGTVVAYDGDGTRRWKQDTPRGLFAPHANDATSFRIAGDTVVLAHPRGRAIAYALADGSVQWDVSIPSRSHRPAIANGRVFLTGGRTGGGRGSIVQARSLSDGSEQWRNDTDGPIKIGPGVHHGVVYTADIDGRLIAWAGADGTEQWRVRIDGGPWVSTIPVVFDDTVWVGTLSEGLYGVTADGIDAHAEIDIPTTPAVGPDRVYVGSSDFGTGSSGDATGVVSALDGNGNVTWHTATRGHPESQLHYRDGHVVFGTDTGIVERLAANDGHRAWRAFERPTQLPAPVIGPATVYCGSRDDSVGGYRATDGTSHLWGVRLDGPAPGTPTVAGETVLAGSHGGDIAGTPLLEYAEKPAARLTRTPTPDPDASPTPHIDAPSPEPRWRATLDGPIGDIGYGTDSAYLGSGTAVVAMTADGTVYWVTDVGGRVRGAPAVDDTTVYAATTDGTVLSLATDDGTVRWRRDVGESATAPAVTHSEGVATLAVGTESGVVALATADGSERWRAAMGHVRGPPALAGRLVVVGDETGVLRGIGLPDGTEQWQHETGGPIHGAPAVAGQTAYIGSRDGYLYAVSLDDGSVTWRVELLDWVDGSPAVAYGAVFVVDQSGALSVIVGDR